MRRSATEVVRAWASQLAAESRDQDNASRFYVWPKSLFQISEQLRCTEGCIIGVVGLQGVGKSSALLALEATEKVGLEQSDVVLFKWQREKDLYESLLEENHEASREFLQEYREALVNTYGRMLQEPNDRYVIPIRTIERVIGKNRSEVLRRRTWLDILRIKKVILIDTPDYSRTDKRAMARDLDDIHRLWVDLCKTRGQKPNIVLAVQKEMFGGHLFFDKMQKIELEPLEPEQMIEAYKKHFGTTKPFTEEALLTLALMSRGVFRRFLRYINLALEVWLTHPDPGHSIDRVVVKEAVTFERLAEDMEFELAGVFPRQSDAPRQAVQLLMELEEHGSLKQSKLVKRLGIKDYSLSRLIAKLEQHRYVQRERSGTDKIVSLVRTRKYRRH
jgi:hypothetical protein